MNIVFFDLETGGLKIEQPVIQIAAIAIDGEGNELGIFQEKIKFDASKADKTALQINHYDKNVWDKEAKTEVDVVNSFARFLAKYADIPMTAKGSGRPYKVARLAAHNSEFDAPRLKAMFKKHNAFFPAHQKVLCTIHKAVWWAFDNNQKISSYKLTDLCKFMNIAVDGKAHDALTDVRMTVQMAMFLKKESKLA